MKYQKWQQEVETVGALVCEDLKERIIEGVELSGENNSNECSTTHQNESCRELLRSVELEFDRVQHFHFKLIPKYKNII